MSNTVDEVCSPSSGTRDTSRPHGFRALFRVLRRFLPLIGPLWDKILLRIVLNQGYAFLAVCQIMVLAKGVDDGMNGGSKRIWLLWSGVWLALYFGGAVLSFLRLILAGEPSPIPGAPAISIGYIATRVNIRLKSLMHDHVQRLSLRFHQSRPVGEHMWRIHGDTDASLDLVCNFAPEFVERVLQILTALGMVTVLSPVAGLCIGAYIIMKFFFLHYIASYVRMLNLRSYAAVQAMSAVLQENFSGFLSGKAMSRERNQRRRYLRALVHVFRTGLRYMAVMHVWGESSYLLRIWLYNIVQILICGILMVRQKMTMGEYIAMGVAMVWLTEPIETLIWLVERMRVAAVPAERMLDTIEVRPEIVSPSNPVVLTQPRGELVFENVTFRYASNGRDVLRNVSFKVPPGKKTAIVGPSGAGKSTLFSLAMRDYDPDSGRILIDGQDLRDLELESYRNQTAIVLQDTFLFSATLRDNILFGNLWATEEQLREAVRRAGVDLFLGDMADGLDTLLTAEGGNISGGQRQRVGMARAIIRQPRFLFLDEATSALDPLTEREVLTHLHEMQKGLTTIVAAHDLRTLCDADEILVLEAGRIIQRGTHESLLREKSGLYGRMWQKGAEYDRHPTQPPIRRDDVAIVRQAAGPPAPPGDGLRPSLLG